MKFHPISVLGLALLQVASAAELQKKADGASASSEVKALEGTAAATAVSSTVPAIGVALRGEPPKVKRQGGGPENPERPFRPEAPPVLQGADLLKTFKLPPGFRIELVAAEPLVDSPVAVSWDEKGRMYVVEMRSYMHDMEGAGEDQAVGRVKLLEDTDGDGVYDKATVFLDNQVMPRAVMAVGGGVVVITPPTMTFYKDTNGDGVADYSYVVDDDCGKLGGQPEYLPNSPYWGLDNWINLSLHNRRYRFEQGVFSAAASGKSGQWGRTQDDWGRQYYNSNSDLLRVDSVPALWYERNQKVRDKAAIGMQVIKEQTVWPGHMTPGVNRGYQLKTLRPDGSLMATTATCGPGVYRGDALPSQMRGDVFIPEPAGNLVRRLVLNEKDGMISGTNAYEQQEFLTSTDERFRPVNAVTGPDGALYIVDMARGVIQHKVFLTYYLAANILERKLETPITLGRIYRIVPENWKPKKTLPFSSGASELVARLESANGWERDTAQRLLVESRSLDALPHLERLVKSASQPQTRVQALWTIEGLHKLTPELIKTAAADADPKVRMAAVQLATEASWQEGFTSGAVAKAAGGVSQAWLDACAPTVLALSKDKASEVQVAVAFQLPLLGTAEADAAALALLKRSANKLVAQGFVTGYAGREMELFSKLVALPATEDRWLLGSEVLKTLASAIAADRKPASLEFLFGEAARLTMGNARQLAVLDAVAGKPPAKSRGKAVAIKPVVLTQEPVVLASLEKGTDKAGKALGERLSKMLVWPGKKDAPVVKAVVPLNKEQKELFEKGKAVYASICIACHQPNGAGLAGLAPSLAGSEWVNGPDDQPIRIVLQGLTGPIEVAGQKWQLEMPGLPQFSDQDVAAVLTYIRREWENDGDPVLPEHVADVRTKIQGRNRPWTAEELQSPPR